jgi:hypothetical protein
LKVCHIGNDEYAKEKLCREGKKIPQIQDFDFLKVLGKGGFATVYMGK